QSEGTTDCEHSSRGSRNVPADWHGLFAHWRLCCPALIPSRHFSTSKRIVRIVSTLATQRHLLATMVRRDISARFAGSSLGGLWTLIHPAILLSLYTMVFAYIYRV